MDPLLNLIEAIDDEPHDLQSQLVLADHLLSLGDPRGELIALECRERMTPGGMIDPDALEQLLLLAAELTFPCARDVPDVILPFRGEMTPVDLVATYEGVHYRVGYRRRRLTITIQNGVGQPAVVQFPRKVVDRVQASSTWTADEAQRMLRVITDAIVHRAPLRELQFPLMAKALPEYSAGAVRCYRLPPAFTGPRRISPTRYGLAARDHERWHAIWSRLRSITEPASR